MGINGEKNEINDNNEKHVVEGEILKQKVVDKQKQALLYSYETLGNLLSAAENFAGFPNEQYENFNISSANSHKELKAEFGWELNCFNMAIKKYRKKYGEYIFPENYSKEKILKDIKKYIKNTKDEKDKTLYYAMINIINDKKIDINFDELFEETEDKPDSKFEPNKLNNIIGPINSILDDIEKKAEDGKISFNEGKSKQKEKLMNNKKIIIPEIYTVIIGKKGNLYKLNEQNNEYKFINEENKEEKILLLDEKIDYKNKKFYLGKYGKETISVYINDKNDDFFICSIFGKEIKEYKKSDIVILDNNYGYLKVPVLLFEDLK
jgi:hypothetical protein